MSGKWWSDGVFPYLSGRICLRSRELRRSVPRLQYSPHHLPDMSRRFVEQVLSVAATCRQQGRNVLEYLASCFQARVAGDPLPSLLACPAVIKLALIRSPTATGELSKAWRNFPCVVRCVRTPSHEEARDENDRYAGCSGDAPDRQAGRGPCRG